MPLYCKPSIINNEGENIYININDLLNFIDFYKPFKCSERREFYDNFKTVYKVRLIYENIKLKANQKFIVGLLFKIK